MSDELFRFLFILGLLVLLYPLIYYVQNGTPGALRNRAFEAAEFGDTREALQLLDRLLAGWEKKPQRWFSPMSLASNMVILACEWEHPETALAVLAHLGFTTSELLWEEEGQPAIPLSEYVQANPVFVNTRLFLEHMP